MAELLIENLHKRYGPVKAIDDVNIHVADGEFVTLLGPSGCGKSTTLGAIAGLDQPTSGRIRVGNKTIRRRKGNLPAAGSAPLRARVPELRFVATHDGL
ncbi:ABC-type sugar transport system ATPase subunit [Bradyrhizobium japonicum]|uniref:ATP-binding cassette domain-containing protein n=1 Tax=Bradyrhizobium TaxID=374 RepID=UPI000480BACB|nr:MULTISPECIES: ATP-binding cassette domain-containing protein [Bradyrhizobium]MBR0879851.1 ABC transporter ATP-binding protein [Bradyrhizobium liaoningense]MBR0999797.1 ABC transporter ATP-binding protein [Bradyrhizobium liaoningense]MBR1064655.1 ABC transporter ATP-binding protein [Bradyrhizobium liaoningense]MCP1741087.1 ABC-type sugar transport system ATPase subunit [Bradyrhizobium japonicum]MCP1780142.1 ABC-type sugar transport system ATPase subunit [Bradyrhizobium japonicum]